MLPSATGITNKTAVTIVGESTSIGTSSSRDLIPRFPYTKAIREANPLILRETDFYKHSIDSAACIIATDYMTSPAEYIKFLMKMIDTLRDVNDDETNSQLAFKFIEDVFKSYEMRSKDTFSEHSLDSITHKIFEFITAFNSDEIQTYKHNNKFAPGNKAKILSCMIALELKKCVFLKTDNQMDAAKLPPFLKTFLQKNAKHLFEIKFNLAHLIDALKTVEHIDIKALMFDIKQAFFITPYHTYMSTKGYSTLGTLKTAPKATSITLSTQAFTDAYGTAGTIGLTKLALNEYMTFGWGDCGFVASHVPRSFIRAFIENENNAYLYRLFVNNLKPSNSTFETVWRDFCAIINSDSDWLFESDMAALVNLFQHKQLFFLSSDNQNNLIEMAAIDSTLLPDHTVSEHQYFIRHSGAHYTYCVLPGDVSGNHIGELKAQMSQAGSTKRRTSPNNQSVEALNFTL